MLILYIAYFLGIIYLTQSSYTKLSLFSSLLMLLFLQQRPFGTRQCHGLGNIVLGMFHNIEPIFHYQSQPSKKWCTTVSWGFVTHYRVEGCIDCSTIPHLLGSCGQTRVQVKRWKCLLPTELDGLSSYSCWAPPTAHSPLLLLRIIHGLISSILAK
jgi:hypothetical protein